MTNYERIKNMMVEEMSKMFSEMCRHREDCPHCPFYDDCPEDEGVSAWKDWLISEVRK